MGERFDYRIAPFPMPSANGKLPAGGNLAVMLTKDPKKQAIAWEYIKFVTGPIGQTLMATQTGYLPGNEIPMNDPDMLGEFLPESPKRASRRSSFLTSPAGTPIPEPMRSRSRT